MPAASRSDHTHYPWLEYFPEGGDRVESTRLDNDAFTIGRSDVADVQIDSTKVSREHARIVHLDERYVITDLQSTNGTFVNGERIEQAELMAGDVILVADTEFVFLMDSVSRLRRMATQQMPTRPNTLCGGNSPARVRQTQQAVMSLRAAHEQLRRRFTPVDVASILEMPAATPFALLERSLFAGRVPAGAESCLLQPPSHALIRLREVHRLETIKRCLAISACSQIIVPVEPWEISEIKTLILHFETLATMLPRKVSLLATVSAAAAVDVNEVQQFCRDLQNMGIAISCHGFVGSHVHVENLAELCPQLLLLNGDLSVNLADSPQRRDRLDSVVQACSRLGIRPVITGDHDPPMMELLWKMGIDLFLPANPTLESPSSDTGLPGEVLTSAACD